MMNVVFTGPAFDGEGNSVLRTALTYACIVKGNLTVQDRIQADTDMLVASRTDTVKALNAAKRGIAVLGYPEFINNFLRGIELPKGGKANKYTDHVDLDLLVPDFTDGKLLEQLDIL